MSIRGVRFARGSNVHGGGARSQVPEEERNDIREVGLTRGTCGGQHNRDNLEVSTRVEAEHSLLLRLAGHQSSRNSLAQVLGSLSSVSSPQRTWSMAELPDQVESLLHHLVCN